jgi:hypothetical protein
MAQVLKKLPRVRSHWPAEARLTKPAQFNIYDGDQVVGVVRLNAGTKVKVVEITLQHALVRVGSTQSPLPVSYTDIVDIMGGASEILALPDDAAPADTNKT